MESWVIKLIRMADLHARFDVMLFCLMGHNCLAGGVRNQDFVLGAGLVGMYDEEGTLNYSLLVISFTLW